MLWEAHAELMHNLCCERRQRLSILSTSPAEVLEWVDPTQGQDSSISAILNKQHQSYVPHLVTAQGRLQQ